MISLLALVALAAAAEPAPTSSPSFDGVFPRRTITCVLGPRKLELILAGITKDVADEEKEFGSPYLFARRANAGEPGDDRRNKGPVFVVGGPQTNLTFLKKTGSNHYCRDTIAFRAGRGLLGIAFQVDDRPSPEQLGVAFFDLRHNRLVDAADRLGAFTGLRLERTALEFRSIISRTDSTGDVETNIKGKVVVLEEDELRPWYRVTLSDVGAKGASNGSRLVRSADRERTWNESPWRPFFKTREGFEQAFGYEAEHAVYKKPWVYIAHVKDKPNDRCILPSDERLPHIKADSPWVCSKPGT